MKNILKKSAKPDLHDDKLARATASKVPMQSQCVCGTDGKIALVHACDLARAQPSAVGEGDTLKNTPIEAF